MEGEADLGVADLLGLSVVGGEAGIGVWLRGDGEEGFAGGSRGVLKGDLKGLERASVLSRRRRLRDGRADISVRGWPRISGLLCFHHPYRQIMTLHS